MRIERRDAEGWLAIVQASGELDAYTAPELRTALQEAMDGGAKFLLADLSDVEYMDSVGLGILVAGAKRAAAEGGALSVACARPSVTKVFEISGTHELLGLQPSADQAREFLASRRQKNAGSDSGS